MPLPRLSGEGGAAVSAQGFLCKLWPLPFAPWYLVVAAVARSDCQWRQRGVARRMGKAVDHANPVIVEKI